jgi:general secretion pathway protein A
MVAAASHGIPRVINILCDTALVYGFAIESHQIDRELVALVIEDKRKYGIFPINGTAVM